jgi:hypothetical protein
MNVSRELLSDIGLPQTTFMNLTEATALNLLFATAASDNHFKESLAAVARIQHLMPGHKILYYDLGLTEDQAKQVRLPHSLIFICPCTLCLRRRKHSAV